MIHVHINIGSNLGDRQDNLRRAVAAVRQLAVDVSTVKVSDIAVSPPWGYESDNEYYNIGVSFDTELTPEALLAATQNIEKTISDTSHRDSAGNYIDRIIDIDIIAAAKIDNEGKYGRLMTSDTDTLTLPHPRALLREFVLAPLDQIDPILLDLMRDFML